MYRPLPFGKSTTSLPISASHNDGTALLFFSSLGPYGLRGFFPVFWGEKRGVRSSRQEVWKRYNVPQKLNSVCAVGYSSFWIAFVVCLASLLPAVHISSSKYSMISARNLYYLGSTVTPALSSSCRTRLICLVWSGWTSNTKKSCAYTRANFRRTEARMTSFSLWMVPRAYFSPRGILLSLWRQ